MAQKKEILSLIVTSLLSRLIKRGRDWVRNVIIANAAPGIVGMDLFHSSKTL